MSDLIHCPGINCKRRKACLHYRDGETGSLWYVEQPNTGSRCIEFMEVEETIKAWKCEQRGCWVCERTAHWSGLHCHEIANGSDRAKARREPACWIFVCGECHVHLQDKAEWPMVRQLALKMICDPERYDLAAVLRIVGWKHKSDITQATVDAAAETERAKQVKSEQNSASQCNCKWRW
jgi:hypothetical protein